MIATVDAEDPVTRPLPLLTGYDAKRCQRRVHNDHDATLDTVPWEVPPDLQERFAAGKSSRVTSSPPSRQPWTRSAGVTCRGSRASSG